NSVNNIVKRVRMIHEDQDQKEESSWIIYFEDIDHEEGREETIHYYDSDSSMISDAASPVHTTKINNLGFSVLDVAEYNAKHGISMDNVTSEERGCLTDTVSKINEEFFLAELKKRGLCVVPLSMLSNFIA
ncbi:hypothetical protein HID58_020810, partial [Brassica napus]